MLLTSAEQYSLVSDFEKSNEVLSSFAPSEEQRAKYYYLKSINHFALNNKAEALKAIEVFDWAATRETPERYKAMVFQMKHHIDNWKDPISDIERDMRKSVNKLENSYSGKKTQEIQENIIKKLDKLIKDKEDENNPDKNKDKNQDPNAQPGDGKPQPKDGQNQNTKPEMPKMDSVIMGGNGPGKVDERDLKKIAERWGTLPPAMRAKVIQDITRDLPQKYERQIKDYFESLSKYHDRGKK